MILCLVLSAGADCEAAGGADGQGDGGGRGVRGGRGGRRGRGRHPVQQELAFPVALLLLGQLLLTRLQLVFRLIRN